MCSPESRCNICGSTRVYNTHRGRRTSGITRSRSSHRTFLTRDAQDTQYQPYGTRVDVHDATFSGSSGCGPQIPCAATISSDAAHRLETRGAAVGLLVVASGGCEHERQGVSNGEALEEVLHLLIRRHKDVSLTLARVSNASGWISTCCARHPCATVTPICLLAPTASAAYPWAV